MSAEWLKYPENKPATFSNCMVSNSKGWMYRTRAIYHPREDVFVLFDPNYRETLVLNVTHFFVIPDSIRI